MTSSYSEKIAKLKNALENVFVKKTDIQNNLTSTDTNKPLSANQGKVLDTNKVDKISGKSLSTNDFTNTYKTKLDNLDTLLESKASNTHTHGNLQNNGSVGTSNNINKNVITDGNGKITTEDKPTIPSKISDLTNDSNFIETSSTIGLIKNDGSIDTNSYITISSVPTQTSDLTNDGADGTSTYAETDDISTAITTHNSSMYSHQDIRTLLNQKEVTTNKVSSITSNTGSTTKYPNIQAIEDYAEPKKSPLAISQLSSLISSASNNGTIVLDNDYVNGTSNQNIYISDKNITIIGNGHTIDSNNKLVSFILSNATVTIYDCNFINNTSTSSSSSLFKVAPSTGPGTVSLNNCTFKNSSIKYYLISIEGGTLNIRDCFFYNNAQTGSRYILYIKNSNLDIQNTIFENNTLKPVSITNTNTTSRSQTITECIFNNNVSAITESSSNESYKQVVLKNNYFVQAGDTVTGCTNNNYLTQHQDITGKENTSNKVTSWTATVTDTNYPSEKLVKDSLDAKANTNSLSTVATTGSYTDLSNKPSIDDTVTQSSSNAVKSSGIYSALQTKQEPLSSLSAEIDEYGNSIFNDDSNRFYSTNDRIYHDWADTDELHFIKTNGDDVNFDDIILEGDSRLTNARTPTSHSHSISNITNLQTSLDDKAEESDLLDLIYPIGSIYMKKGTGTTSICPIEQTLGGTWTRIENRFLYASEGGQGVGSTGGSETVTLTAAQSGVPAHGHGMAHTHNHRHTMSRRDTYHGSGSAAGAVGYTTSLSLIANSSYDNTASSKSTTDNNTAQDASEAHNNMPPYIIVNVWERTA